jgi:dTMP kinase
MFITFEGIEGCGKTTQIKLLRKTLNERGVPYLITREPGATKIGLQIRAVLLDQKNKKLDPKAELFLYLADRCQHLNEKILPALAQGRWVISDRFWDATVVYQGLARGLNLKLLNQLRPTILGSLWPDKTFLLDYQNKKMVPLAELFLYLADRCQHLNEKIQPALSQGQWVISDRFWDATVVYQGMARGLDVKILNQLRPRILGSLWPDKTFLLDLPVSIGLARAWERINESEASKKESRFEEEAKTFHEKIRLGYLSLARKEPERIKVIDAILPPAKIHQQIVEILFK